MRTRDKLNKYMKSRRAALKEKGICVDCQNTQTKDGHVCCTFCLDQRRERERVRHQALPFGSPIEL